MQRLGYELHWETPAGTEKLCTFFVKGVFPESKFLLAFFCQGCFSRIQIPALALSVAQHPVPQTQWRGACQCTQTHECVRAWGQAHSSGAQWQHKGHKLKHRSFHLNMRKNCFNVRVTELWNRLSPTQELSGHHPLQPVIEGWTTWGPEVPSNLSPQPFCDSVREEGVGSSIFCITGKIIVCGPAALNTKRVQVDSFWDYPLAPVTTNLL